MRCRRAKVHKVSFNCRAVIVELLFLVSGPCSPWSIVPLPFTTLSMPRSASLFRRERLLRSILLAREVVGGSKRARRFFKGAGSKLSNLQTPHRQKKKNETLQSPIPGIVLTNDGNAILREIDVSHPAAKVRVENGEKKEGPLFFRLRLLLFFLLCFSPLSPPSVVALFFFFKILFQPKKQH